MTIKQAGKQSQETSTWDGVCYVKAPHAVYTYLLRSPNQLELPDKHNRLRSVSDRGRDLESGIRPNKRDKTAYVRWRLAWLL